jgi:hypothetical protein
MAGGMLTKQADMLTAKFLNDVNDAVSGGAIISVPSGAPAISYSQTKPGDRIVLDDASALALSDTAIGTLLGGVYMYYGTLATATASPARGTIAFFRAIDLGVASTSGGYQVTSDAQPTTPVPTYIAGIFINAITKGNFGWVQVAGAASVLFDSSALTAIAAGNWVSAKVAAATVSTADVGAVAGVVTLAALLGVAVGVPNSSTISIVMLTRGNLCGRI